MNKIDKYNQNYINLENCDIEKIRDEVNSKGYCVVDNLIKNEDFILMKSHWYEFFNNQLKNRPNTKPVK